MRDNGSYVTFYVNTVGEVRGDGEIVEVVVVNYVITGNFVVNGLAASVDPYTSVNTVEDFTVLYCKISYGTASVNSCFSTDVVELTEIKCEVIGVDNDSAA